MNESMQNLLHPQRPLTILIAAPDAEGGSMLAGWLVAAAAHCDYPAQSTSIWTSIPGAVPHAGASTRYVEIYPMTTRQLDGRQPVMALAPTPGGVDVVAALELVEAGRALQHGYVDATRTKLLASSHRVYAVSEKSAAGDGRTDSEKILTALKSGAHSAVLFDMAQVAARHGATVDAVLLGALTGSGALPLTRAACERAIREGGKDAEASLRAFAAGYELALDPNRATAPAVQPKREAPRVERVRQRFPSETFAVLEAGVARLIDYQDPAYAELYLDRLEPILALDREAGGTANGYKLTCETGRLLALWMSYEDLIRVAELKTRKGRFERLRGEVGAGEDDVVTVTEYLKPGLDDICAVLPAHLAQRLRGWVEKNGKKSLAAPAQLKSSSLRGFLMLRAVSGLRRWRRQSERYQLEHKRMDRWLGAIKRLGFAVQDVELALEIAECARLMNGYGETHRNGVVQFEKIFDSIIESGTEPDPKKLAQAIARARKTALGEPNAASAGPSKSSDPGKPIFWMPRKEAEKTPAGLV